MKSVEMYKARIALLQSRKRDNGNIVKKLERKIRASENK
jgi:hypothetical protein